MPCATLIQRLNKPISISQYLNWSFTITSGYNRILLDYPKAVRRGQMIYLTQNTANVAIDTTAVAPYSDIAWKSYLEKINQFSNNRFYLDSITNYTSYYIPISLYYSYSDPGLYNLRFSYSNCNKTYQQNITITDCKFNY